MESIQQQSTDGIQDTDSKGLKITTIVMSIIALCGIGFGIYGMIQKNSSIADLKVQIKNEDGTTTTIETPKIETTTVNGDTTVTITDSNVTTENPEDYIYVGEWGLKIKIPEGLDKVGYSLQQALIGIGQTAITSLSVTGVKGFDGRLPGFVSENFRLGVVTRVLKGSFDDIGTNGGASEPNENEKACGTGIGYLVYSDGTYNYCYHHPQGLYSTGDELQGLEIESANLVQDMLRNSNNYSKF